MEPESAIVAVYAKHDAAEAAVRRVATSGFDMRKLSIVGKGYHTEEKVIGFYSTGDRMRFWGGRGAYWGGLWGLLFGGLMLTVPVIGPVMVLGYLAAAVFATVAGTVEGAVLGGGMGALGAALFSIGIPEHSVLQYEQALTADSYLVIGHGPPAKIERIKHMLEMGDPLQLEFHESAANRAQIAA